MVRTLPASSGTAHSQARCSAVSPEESCTKHAGRCLSSETRTPGRTGDELTSGTRLTPGARRSVKDRNHRESSPQKSFGGERMAAPALRRKLSLRVEAGRKPRRDGRRRSCGKHSKSVES